MNLIANILNIPLSIVLGIGIGAIIGFILIKFFKNYSIRDTKKAILILAIAILFNSF